MKTPPKGTHYICSDGTKADTLADWQRAELLHVLKADGQTGNSFADLLLSKAEEIVEILSFKEAGRPNGRKDSKPRAKRTDTVTTANTP